MITYIKEPIIHLMLPVIYGPLKELLRFAKKHNMKIDEELMTGANAAVVEYTENDCIKYVTWFRYDEQNQSVEYRTACHEIFHLWDRIVCLMLGTDEFLVDKYNDEHDAYHFGNLAELVFGAVTKMQTRHDKKMSSKHKPNTGVKYE